MANLKLIVCVLVGLLVASSSAHHVKGLSSFFYAETCPGAEFKIAELVLQAIRQNFLVAPQFIRLCFHDCFVEGCDASILLDSPTAEKTSIPDTFFTVFDLVDSIKAEIEELCPGVVSCADIIAFAGATSVIATGGPFVDVQGGRYDGFVSSATEALANIPSPFSTQPQLITNFANKGLTVEDLVWLSGAHTVGVGHCGAFTNRLGSPPDPTLNAAYEKVLVEECPPASFGPNVVVNMDTFTPNYFDTGYFKDVATGKGLFTSDAALYDSGTQAQQLVDSVKNNDRAFFEEFAGSFKRMTAIGVKTPPNGNVRANCRSTVAASSPPPKPYY